MNKVSYDNYSHLPSRMLRLGWEEVYLSYWPNYGIVIVSLHLQPQVQEMKKVMLCLWAYLDVPYTCAWYQNRRKGSPASRHVPSSAVLIFVSGQSSVEIEDNLECVWDSSRMRNAKPWHTSSGGCRPQLPGHNPLTPGWCQLLHLHGRANHFHLTTSVFCNLLSLGPLLWYPSSTSIWCCWQSPLQQSKLLYWHFHKSLMAEAAFRDLWCPQFMSCHHLWVSHSTSHFPSCPSIPICHHYIGLLLARVPGC